MHLEKFESQKLWLALGKKINLKDIDFGPWKKSNVKNISFSHILSSLRFYLFGILTDIVRVVFVAEEE